jgi:hypothetical protein
MKGTIAMPNLKKVAVMFLAALGAALGLGLVSPGIAAAAGYNGACGSGYRVIDSHHITGGTIYLTYNGSRNCVVTIRNNPGAAVPMNAWIKRSTSSVWIQDPGRFTSYAGPVYVTAPGVCIDWGGGITSSSWTEWRSHCR